MTIRTVTEPSFEPITLVQARSWAKVTAGDTTFDADLTILIAAMRRHAENLTGRAFMHRQLQLLRSGWPTDLVEGISGHVIELPYPPLAHVQSIQYYDIDGVIQTLATDQYVVHSWREPAIIVPEWEALWPTVRGLVNAVQVNYVAGYPVVGSPEDEVAQQAAVPQNLKLWIASRLATLFENREQIIVGSSVAELPRSYADGLLDELVIGSRAV